MPKFDLEKCIILDPFGLVDYLGSKALSLINVNIPKFLFSIFTIEGKNNNDDD